MQAKDGAREEIRALLWVEAARIPTMSAPLAAPASLCFGYGFNCQIAVTIYSLV